MYYAVVYLNYDDPEESNICWDRGHEVFDTHYDCLQTVKAWTKAAHASYKGVYAVCVVDESVLTKKIYIRIDYIHEVGGS